MTEDASPSATAPVVDALVQVSFAVSAVLTRSAAEHELSVTQLRMLGILRDRAPSMAALAEYLGLDRSSVSGLIDRAERRGLVARTTSPEDARVTIVSLTAQGSRLAVHLAATVNDGIARLLNEVSASDRTRLVRIAESITGVTNG
ncbi:MAG TPA: MarR family transcriptional regulator [Lacisediminihabitans sp.]|uniref:MarR family winged helix-turn-helix transcriptional regulator n=1 Tax=Lacisediminihabitans sp. TaxID=2787631 RepID=UPI002EDB4C5C